MAADHATLVKNPSAEVRVTPLQRTHQLNDRRSLQLMLRATAGELAQRTPDADNGHRRDPTHAHEPMDLGAIAVLIGAPDRAERADALNSRELVSPEFATAADLGGA
jgi:hypothetical protein